jgi:type IV fimbrial biogenesis protein FimT
LVLHRKEAGCELRRNLGFWLFRASFAQAPVRRVVSMMNRSSRQREGGFTLLEVIVVMAIAAVLMAVAIPSYRYITNANRIAAEVNGLLGDMQFARAEAIKEGQTVTVCVANTGATACAGTGVATWQNGWIVFSDVNGNAQVNTGSGDTIFRVQAPFSGTDTFVANPAAGYVSFNREGFTTSNVATAGLQISLHAVTANSASTRCLNITYVGLMTVQTYGQINNAVTCL